MAVLASLCDRRAGARAGRTERKQNGQVFRRWPLHPSKYRTAKERQTARLAAFDHGHKHAIWHRDRGQQCEGAASTGQAHGSGPAAMASASTSGSLLRLSVQKVRTLPFRQVCKARDQEMVPLICSHFSVIVRIHAKGQTGTLAITKNC